MSDPLIGTRELNFLLHEWLDISALMNRPRFSGHDRGTIDAFLNLAEKLAHEAFLPHYKLSDEKEPWQDARGQVHILPEIAEAVRRHADLGMLAAGFPPEMGGSGMPYLACASAFALFMAGNISAASFTMITAANARLISAFGTPAQIDEFAQPQIEGRWWATMCLSESQAGSSLGDITTRAIPGGEDALGHWYRITGNKMWISAGDHDGADNIVHLVLAKVQQDDGSLPDGTQGISLFIAPKILPDGERNDIRIAGLNHKMGYRGIPNTVLNFGEAGGAKGWLVGSPGQGLAQMFMMMNEARIGVGIGAAALAYRGYRRSVRYAKERLQGRLPARRGGEPVPIIQHADVKRMLLAQKALAEGALALCLYCAKLVDQDDDFDCVELLSLLTPVAKTWPAENGLAANDLAIQVHGGYGYTRDFEVEQIYRDNRLNPIHEGTTGIQALDLLGRKLLKGEAKGLVVLLERVQACAERATREARLKLCAERLLAMWTEIRETIEKLRSLEFARAVENATPFAAAFGHAVVAWLWLDQALCAAAKEDRLLADSKERACRYFYEFEVPRVYAWLAPVAACSDIASTADETVFD